MKKLAIILITFAFSINLLAEDSKTSSLFEGWNLHGLANIIPYLDGRDFEHDTYMRQSTTMKLQLGVEKSITDDISFMIKFQDSRIWGEENSFTNYTANVDLIEGWVKFDNMFSLPLSMQLGRWQMELGTGRIIRHSPWSYEERSFDGVQINYSAANINVKSFYAVQRDGIGYYKHASSERYDYPAERYDSGNLLGIWSTGYLNKQQFDLFGFWEDENHKSDTVHKDLSRVTAGADWLGKIGKLETMAELYFQFGEMQEKSVSAYMSGLQLDYNLTKKFILTAGTAIYSGTEPAKSGDRYDIFSPILGAKHKFLGLMDYFRKIDEGSANLGVNDFFAGAAYGGKNVGDLNYTLRWHYFMSNQKYTSGLNDFGNECDFTLKYLPAKQVIIEWTSAVFIPGDLFLELYKTQNDEDSIHYRNDVSFMSYVRLIVKI